MVTINVELKFLECNAAIRRVALSYCGDSVEEEGGVSVNVEALVADPFEESVQLSRGESWTVSLGSDEGKYLNPTGTVSR